MGINEKTVADRQADVARHTANENRKDIEGVPEQVRR